MKVHILKIRDRVERASLDAQKMYDLARDLNGEENPFGSYHVISIQLDEEEKMYAPEIECCKCGWTGNYSDLIAPTSGHEPSCPECLSDDFLEVEHGY